MRIPISIALFALASAPLAQSVWIVSPVEPGADFASLQAAVDAAATGDTILVRSGSYSNFAIDGKGLDIVVDASAVANLDGFTSAGPFISVTNLAAGQTVTIRGLVVFSGQAFAAFNGIHLQDNAGTIWMEDVELQMLNPFSTGLDDVHGIVIEDTAGAVLVDCTVVGHRASEALIVDGSSVWVYGGQYEGGPAGSTFDTIPIFFGGGDGARVVEGELFASGATLEGGEGGDTFLLLCNPPTEGGNGVQVQGGVFRDLDTTFAAGLGGVGGCSHPNAADGELVDVVGGSRVTIPETARSLASPSPVYEGGTFAQTFTGAPFELVFQRLAFSTHAPTFVPDFAGPSLLGSPQFLRLRGVIGAGGTLAKSLTLADIGLDGITGLFQPIFIDAGTLTTRLGSPTAVAFLDASFAP
jgi:hypothetical protein